MRRIVPATVGAMAACLLGLEITITRIYTVVLWYHFAFLAVSVCLFGVGAAGMYLHFFTRKREADKTLTDLSTYALGFAVSAAISVVVLLQLRLGSLSPSAGGMAKLLFVYILSSVPFFFVGCYMALALRRYHAQAGYIYFADLTGASLGCLSVIPLLSVLGAPSTVFFYALCASLVSFLLAYKEGAKVLRNLAASVAVICFLVVVIAPFTGILEVHYSKGNVEPTHLKARWNSFSRVIAFEREYVEDGRTVKDVMLEIDGVAHTPVNPFDGDPKNSWFHTFNLSALPYSITPDADVLIFGSGGGEHIITALPFNPRHITGVEMNPIVVDMVRKDFADIAGGILDLPNVDIVIDEGRSFLAKTKDFYDVIQFTLVDTWAATVAGGYVLTENNVYTEEAFEAYFDRLKPGGLMTFKRWFKADDQSVEEYSLRLIALMRHVLEKRGYEDFNNKFFVAGYTEFANVIAKPSGFTLEEVSTLLDFCNEHGLEVIYSPFYEMEPNNFHKLVQARDQQTFIDDYAYDISPVNDNRPFFFYTLRPSDLGKVFSLSYSAKIRNIGPLILLVLLGIVLMAVAMFVILPLTAGKNRVQTEDRHEAMRFAGYFGLIGVGFLLVEIALMQKFILFLGHPIYALAVILFSILLFGGVGSFLTTRVKPEKIRGRLASILIFLMVYVTVLILVAPVLFHHLLGYSAWLKAILSMMMLAPAGLAMGMPFPFGIKILGEAEEGLIPWMWAINNAGSVLGSVLAMVIAVNFGFPATIMAGLFCYLLVILLV